MDGKDHFFVFSIICEEVLNTEEKELCKIALVTNTKSLSFICLLPELECTAGTERKCLQVRNVKMEIVEFSRPVLITEF